MEEETFSEKEFTTSSFKLGNSRITLVGENHMRNNPDPKEDERFKTILESNQNSIFILEHDPSDSEMFGTDHNRVFMQQAKDFAIKKGNTLEIMDDDEIKYDRYNVWKEAGTKINKHDFNFMNAFRSIYLGGLGKTIKEISDRIINSSVDRDTKEDFIMALQKYIQITTNDNKKIVEKNLEDLSELIFSLQSYDSLCRERFYQTKIKNIIQSNPNKNIFAVFGKSHIEGIEKTIKNTKYLTPLSGDAKLLWQISNLKSK